ncbi:MAG: transposase [Planctomycetota bacterium]
MITADPRQIKLITHSRNKTDRRDAYLLAQIGQGLPELLSQVDHRSEPVHAYLQVLRTRELLVAQRTQFVNRVRGVMKAAGLKITGCTATYFFRQAKPHISEHLLPSCEPLFAMLEATHTQLLVIKRVLRELLEKYPAAQQLMSVPSVGDKTALTFVLTIENPERIRSNRNAGAYLELTPRKKESGDSSPQLGITKTGDTRLRRLLVLCAHHLLTRGKDCRLKRWGYLRIRGELKKVGHRVAKTTIATTLKNNGIAPSPDRPTTWSTFLKSHADVIGAADFFTVDVWTKIGLVTHYVFFVIHHATRMVEIAGITANPNSAFMAQVARNLTDQVDGFLRDMKYLILDKDALYTKQFVRILKDAGTEVVHTAIQAPNMNSLAERWVLTAKSECLNKMILFGEQHLGRTLSAFADHYHQDRPHQSLDNNLIQPRPGDPLTEGEIVVDERLGGLLRSYRRTA